MRKRIGRIEGIRCYILIVVLFAGLLVRIGFFGESTEKEKQEKCVFLVEQLSTMVIEETGLFSQYQKENRNTSIPNIVYRNLGKGFLYYEYLLQK